MKLAIGFCIAVPLFLTCSKKEQCASIESKAQLIDLRSKNDTILVTKQIGSQRDGLETMKTKDLLDFQKDWERLVTKAHEDYSSLTRDERVWFNIQCLIQDVDNGGLISHYYNSGANYNQDTIEDLVWLGFRDISTFLTQINQLFPNGRPSKDIEERNSVIESWPDGKYDYMLDELDQQFYRKEQDLENKLVQYIERMNLSGEK
ncbi:DMP19 family protein [Dyadobacter sp. OTU695]|uniref:DMP19 family protein n=1 Tax=Dyadobacter sp. OTU695 TaxID=3043860 RepID=UPI00313DE458